MNRVKALASIVFFMALFPAAPLRAQTAAEMDALLETRAASFAQAARFTLVTAELLDQRSAAGEAFVLARERGWLPRRAEPGDSIRLGELCFLVMKAFNMKGSFLYALFPGPRYAFRELNYRRAIPGRRDPALKVPGEELLRILEDAAAYRRPAVPPGGDAGERDRIAAIIQTELERQNIAHTEVRVEDQGIVISLNDIRFMPDSTTLTGREKRNLEEIAAILSRYPDKTILVAGHAALAGSEEGRLKISEDRARAVADYLAVLGIRPREEIIIRAYGGERPLGDNATGEGRAINRRVEIILLDGQAPE
ncbi:MAG: OmpA family protein [Treponema sp.]|nr:OmpA family protein [Treponema sp.]